MAAFPKLFFFLIRLFQSFRIASQSVSMLHGDLQKLFKHMFSVFFCLFIFFSGDFLNIYFITQSSKFSYCETFCFGFVLSCTAL